MEFDGNKAAVITIVTGIIGLIINVNVAVALRKCRQFGYAFGMLCFSQTISNIGNCTAFIFMAGVMTLVYVSVPHWP
uniref:7TM_GPCR_Srx domain-containing protein n=1 Tax=Steinernema glaseri TaxID=37863 RepID=A0A1I7Y0B8_9BILA